MPLGHRENLLHIFQSALAAVNGRARVRAYLEAKKFAGTIYMVAMGKAACAMAQGAQDVLHDDIADAFIVTKRGHAEVLPWPVWEAGHPLVDETSLAAGEQLLAFVERIPKHAAMLVLLSGGTSSLVEALPPHIHLAQLQEINRWLLASSLDINECNRIRRCLSLIKGGRLAQRLYPRPVLCLAISDVPGNDLRAIGSGPLVADGAWQRPLDISKWPGFLTEAMQHVPSTPEDRCFRHVRHEIIVTLDDALRAAADASVQRGYRAALDPAFVAGDAVKAGTRLAQKLLQSEVGVVHVWGGETTVQLPPSPGRGGRNQNLALAAAWVLKQCDNVWFLSAGTDGTDGPTEDAGALVDGGTIARGAGAGLDAMQSLAQADAGSFLEASGDLVHAGPTGTNVMDIMLGLRATT